MTSETMDDLVPLSDSDAQAGGFRHVLRGYDPKQVEDYLDRVEMALNEADERHAVDARRVAALEQQVAELTTRLGEAERQASGRPEQASALGERLTKMLALAEQEAESLVSTAKERASAESIERTKDLEKREREVAAAQREGEAARLDAQKDAEAVRTRAAREAERELAQAKARTDALRADSVRAVAKEAETAREDIRILHEQAQREAAAASAEARRQVDDLARQRDALLGQLGQLQQTLAAVMSPLSGGAPAEAPPARSSPQQPGSGSSHLEPPR